MRTFHHRRGFYKTDLSDTSKGLRDFDCHTERAIARALDARERARRILTQAEGVGDKITYCRMAARADRLAMFAAKIFRLIASDAAQAREVHSDMNAK